ncbi:hypothetical protein M3Y99_01374600 [Aphelenchoides fujianensis]|nr:hypothetical protein M3Y99_01374600 [Aphelenchoides fujianensis]
MSRQKQPPTAAASVSQTGGEAAIVREIQKLLVAEKVEKWDEAVVPELFALIQTTANSLLDEALSAAEHRESAAIGEVDVDAAIRSFQEVFGLEIEKHPKEAIDHLAAKLNEQPLPKPRVDCGLHTPSERFLLLQGDFRRAEQPDAPVAAPPPADGAERPRMPPPTRGRLTRRLIAEQQAKRASANGGEEPREAAQSTTNGTLQMDVDEGRQPTGKNGEAAKQSNGALQPSTSFAAAQVMNVISNQPDTSYD